MKLRYVHAHEGEPADEAQLIDWIRQGAALPGEKMSREPPPMTGAENAFALIDARIAALGDWRGKTLARLRALIHQALPDVAES